MAAVVKGFRDVNIAFAHADETLRKAWLAGRRQLGEPVRRDVEQLAVSSIRHMSASPAWARMRIGVTRTLVYVAPRERGTRSRQPSSRPNLSGLLMDRAMQPALDRHEYEIVANFERLLDHMADSFNRGGVPV